MPNKKIDAASSEQYDAVGNAKHYKQGRYEVIEMMEMIWGIEATISYCEMTAFKYRMRIGHKEGQPLEQDMKKTKWYETKAEELKGRLK